MKILLIGDIFGKKGRKIIREQLKIIKQDYQIDFVIANVENTTHGKGISLKHYHNLKDCGIDVMTSGNHVFDLEETREDIDKFIDLIRPLNSNPFHPGKGTILKLWNKKKVRITNLIGRTFMPPAEHHIFTLEKLLEVDDSDIHLVDFHAEATAEKAALAYYFDGKITACWGTHTHVQTADERILPGGTAFITDLGMTGPSEGIIGAEPTGILQRSKYGFSIPMKPCKEGKTQLNGLILEVSDENNKVVSLQRINLRI